jgi:hypothetical protein
VCCGHKPSRGAGIALPPLKKFEIEVSLTLSNGISSILRTNFGKNFRFTKDYKFNGAFSEIRNLSIVTIS